MTTNNTIDEDIPTSNHIKHITAWFEKTTPSPSRTDNNTQLALHLGKISEMLRSLAKVGDTPQTKEQLSFSADVISFIQKQIKGGSVNLDLVQMDLLGLRNNLSQQIVSAIGVAHMFGLDIETGLSQTKIPSAQTKVQVTHLFR